DGVHKTVVSEEGDESGDAEERRGGHVVAGDRDTVLPGSDLASGGGVGGGRAAAARGPEGDAKRDGDKREEQDEGDVHCCLPPFSSSGWNQPSRVRCSMMW